MGPLKKKINPIHLFISYLISKILITYRVTLNHGHEGKGVLVFSYPSCFNKVCIINEQFLIDFNATWHCWSRRKREPERKKTCSLKMLDNAVIYYMRHYFMTLNWLITIWRNNIQCKNIYEQCFASNYVLLFFVLSQITLYHWLKGKILKILTVIAKEVCLKM